MKILTLIILIIFPLSLFGQLTKKVTNKTKNRREVYFVLESDKKIRHGPYHMFGCGEQVYVKGYYKNGLKDSLWTEYGSHGKYTEGERVGIWEFHFSNGEIEQKYDYTNNTLLFYWSKDSLSNKEYKIIIGSDTIKSRLDRPPLYIGGQVSIVQILILDNRFRYPKVPRKNRASGQVTAAITIDTSGVALNHRITKGVGTIVDEAVLNYIKELPDDWLPGILAGQKVNVEIDFPINYNFIKKTKK